MAWISGLADKAENMLNKLDQNAATALSQAPTINTGEMRKSLSSSSLALKSLSPVKTRPNSGNIRSNDLQQQLKRPASAHSRHSSADSREAITITVEDKVQNFAPPMSSSFSDPSPELSAFKIALAEVTSERDALRSHLSVLNNDKEILQLKARVDELEILAHCLNEEREILQQENLKFQNSNSSHLHTISELEANLAKLQQDYLEIAQKLQMQIKETEQQRQDLQDYRLKAQHTLQMKDNLIAELKAKGVSSNGQLLDSENELHVLQLENDGMRHELESVKEERQSSINQLEQMRIHLQEITQEHDRQITELRESEIALRKELRLERERMLTNESEQRVLTQELYTLRQQYNQYVADTKARLQEKESQLQQMQNVHINQDENAVSHKNFNDAEVRVKALTQALVDKQNTVEIITSEKNALRIQLEKLQEQLSNYMRSYQNSSSSRSTLLSNSTDDIKAQFPLLMTPNPFDNHVARRVKRAYSSLDSAGVRLGTFLRRYPLMRIFVLMYVALLHIWVMFVLLSSTPN